MDPAFLQDGYKIVRAVFCPEEIGTMRSLAAAYFQNGNGFKNAGGRAKPDWIKEDSLSTLRDLVFSKNLDSCVEALIGESVEFTGHNDLHVNRTVGWHKDRLNNDTRKFEINSPWEVVNDDTMKIFKANIYLQDHSRNDDGLMVRHGNHLHENMNIGAVTVLRPALGDIVIFDQRINHRARWSGGYNRFLICMGYGVRNCFFEQFAKGTTYRQDKQNHG
tara:strand:+ start:1298 stop:1954 length:657 start_codon:yes stop_codon:yes gene_type:complete